jgi:hypothetical protein
MTTIPLGSIGPGPAVRAAAVRRGRLLNRLTIGWNAVEGIVAVVAGLAAGSVSLVGFGLDSGIEVSAALILAWRLAQEHGQGCTQEVDRRATRAIAGSFFVLAAYVGVESTRDLLGRAEPEASIPGIILAALSLVVMPLLARAKRKVAPVLGSRGGGAGGNQNPLCGCRRCCWSAWPPTPPLAGGGPTRPPVSESPGWPRWRVCGPGGRSRSPTPAATNSTARSVSCGHARSALLRRGRLPAARPHFPDGRPSR